MTTRSQTQATRSWQVCTLTLLAQCSHIQSRRRMIARMCINRLAFDIMGPVFMGCDRGSQPHWPFDTCAVSCQSVDDLPVLCRSVVRSCIQIAARSASSWRGGRNRRCVSVSTGRSTLILVQEPVGYYAAADYLLYRLTEVCTSLTRKSRF